MCLSFQHAPEDLSTSVVILDLIAPVLPSVFAEHYNHALAGLEWMEGDDLVEGGPGLENTSKSLEVFPVVCSFMGDRASAGSIQSGHTSKGNHLRPWRLDRHDRVSCLGRRIGGVD